MLIRRQLLKELRGFDDRFYLNWEDVDLSLRAKSRGWQIGLVPGAHVYHKVGRSFASTRGTGIYYYVRNQLLLVSLHAEHHRVVNTGIIVFHLGGALSRILRREPKSVRSALLVARAITDFIRNKFGPLDAALVTLP